MKKGFALLLGMAGVLAAGAQLRLPAVIGDNMVLQQQSAVALWGWGNASERMTVTTSWNSQTDSAVVNKNGKWRVIVNTPAAGGPYSITFRGSKTLTVNNVMIGEVWLCSGQSNMEYHSMYGGSKDIQPEIPLPENNNIHLFLQPKVTAHYPQEDSHASWAITDSNSRKVFSQVAYFFAKKINQELNVPVGIIEAAWGGTPAEVWTPAEAVLKDDSLTEAAHKQMDNRWWPIYPGYAYNAMIAPVTDYSIAGALWYQGEGNTVAPATYARLLGTMVQSWRADFHKDFPFYYVQIAPFTYGQKYQGSVLQEQETRLMSTVENTGMVVTTDLVPDTTDIHPNMKKAVGERLANWALVKTYNKSGIPYASPMFSSISVDGSKATITFSHAEEGLVIKGSSIKELYVAGGDKLYYPAQAKISGSKLMVWSDNVKQPVAVRFGFSNAAVGNLFSKNGLPVVPFRTDNWNVLNN